MKVAAIALNTFKEAVRDKLFYSLVFFAAMLTGASVLLSNLSVGEEHKILADFSLAAINLFGVLIAIFSGVGLVSKELEKKTIYTIISKPVKRYQFLLGKYAGLALTLLVYISIMTSLFIGIYVLYSSQWNFGGILLAVLFIYVELLVITACAMLFSTFSTPALSATYTIAIYIIGHLAGDLKLFAEKTEMTGGKSFFEFLYYLMPNLGNLNIKGRVVYGETIDPAYVFYVLSYSLLYVALLLLISAMVFEKRNFK